MGVAEKGTLRNPAVTDVPCILTMSWLWYWTVVLQDGGKLDKVCIEICLYCRLQLHVNLQLSQHKTFN